MSVIGAVLIAGVLWLGLSTAKFASAPPTLKIGLIAPFEGLYRSTGYDVLFAVKLALQERNLEGVNGYRFELVALNDFNEPADAYRQAQALVADPDIVGVIGHLSAATTAAALPVYQEAQLATVIPWSADDSVFAGDRPGVVSVAATSEQTAARLDAASRELGFQPVAIRATTELTRPAATGQPLVLDTDAVSAGNIAVSLREAALEVPLFGRVDVGDRQLPQVAGTAADGLIFVSPGPAAADIAGHDALIAAYESLAGLPPGPRALLAYDATNVLLDSVEKAMIIDDQRWFNDQPGRADVRAAIASVRRSGVTGEIIFDNRGRRLTAPIWVYQIDEANYPGKLIAP